MILTTPRLVLRELKEDDFPALYRVFSDPTISAYYPYDFDECRVHDWIKRNLERYRVLGFGLWAVCRRDSGEVIGDCGLTMQTVHGFIVPEIGYHIRSDCQRKGYATEAACAVRDWAFRSLPFGVLYSYMKDTNIPSACTAMAYGCREVDLYDDPDNGKTRVFAITRKEWQQL